VKIYRVGIVGAGQVSAYHIRALQSLENVEIVGITDLDPIRGGKVASEFKIPFFKTTQEMYSAKPDVVHVLTPPSSHYAVAIEALEMGCHVFVEKPMAVSEEECDLMIQKAASVQRVLSVDHSARFGPAVLKALELIQTGAVGDVLSVDYFRSSEYPSYRGGPMPQPFQEGGYPYRDIGVHALYLMEAFLGPIREVETSHRGTGRDPHLMFDVWSGLGQCEKGVGHFQLSWTSRPITHTLSIHTSRGTILLDMYLETCVVCRKLPAPKPVEALVNSIVTAFLSVVQVCWNSVRIATGRMVRGSDIHRSVREFHIALSHGSNPPVSATEGKRIVAWVEQAARQADADKHRMNSTSSEVTPPPILVTGAAGFLGSRLVHTLLSQGKRVRLLVHRRPTLDVKNHSSLDVITGDLGDPGVVDRAIRGVETVYHVGAATNGCWADFESGTIWGTKNVVASCLRHQVKKLVYVSSLSVLQYAGLPARTQLDESALLESFPEKRGNYANSKLEAEKIVVDAVRERGLKAIILRPGSIFGPGAEKVPPYGIIPVGNRWIVMGGGNALLPLVFVDDVVDALLKSAECDEAIGQIIQLVDTEQITQREYLKYCLTRLHDIKVHHMPMSLLYCAAATMQCLGALARINVPLTIYRLRSIRPHIEFRCDVARRVIGWEPRVGIRKGLESTFTKLPVLGMAAPGPIPDLPPSPYK
jgi:predicted dehydrogenase/nucleoside-diphosphate-sugar epimerase